MQNEYNIIRQIIQQFEGLQKIEAFDILHKLEVLLLHAKSPLQTKALEQIIQDTRAIDIASDPMQSELSPSGYYCECIGNNDWLYLYKEQPTGIRRLFLTRYYFKTTFHPLQLQPFTKKQLRIATKGTPVATEVEVFLNLYSVMAREDGEFRVLGL